ncbi:restriction endonuclease subunit S [Salmonella enterica]|nr:restriction endonuclease subunit S [Salmonella enterica]ECJ4222650.1 restriction endonuclease subunit S [Salmonella enterica subsp. enterica]EDW2322523.1 restriction endonuclease subunit S [Salmonella enterica subsp. enterica]ELO9003519.1 restriction endonuclease subunit S [Salmonella enterica]ELZ8054992.1 restriction endonuclease subunit S [Salmonella enterica]
MSGGKLPEGWAKAPVSTVTTLIRGVTYKKEQAINYLQDDYLPLIRANNIQNGKFDTTDLVFVPKNLVKESQRISPEDIVIAMSSGSKSVVGKSAHQRLPFECSFGAFCGVLRPEKRISPSFIAHFTKSSFYRNKISSLSAGANINNIKPASFDLINIPIPALAEQKIIAEKLDTLLAQVDSTKARLEQIPQILKRFRQAVLNTAVRGDLTKSWRENTQLTSMVELLEKCISLRSGKLRVRKNAITENYKNFISLPDSWAWSENYNLAKDNSNSICAGPFGTIFKAKDFRSEGIPIIFLRHVKEGVFNQNKPTFMDREIWEKLHQDYSIFGGELLVTKLGDPPGESCIYPQKFGTAMVTPDVLKMDVDNEIANTKYLMHYFNSPLAKKIIAELAFGATRLRIDIAMFKNFPVPLPSLEEQHEIVRRVEQLFAYADTIEKQVNSALTRVNSLTQSILAKAFRGELTTQWRAENPDLISGENSAAALLEKIKAERAASGGKKASRKKA